MERIQSTWMFSRLFTGPYILPSRATSTVTSPTLRSESYFIIRMPPTRYSSSGPTLDTVEITPRNQRPAMPSRMFRSTRRPLAS